MIDLKIEGEYCQELWAYADLGIMDKRTDGDRLMANLIAGLIGDKLVNKERFDNFLYEALVKLEVSDKDDDMS